MVQKQTCPNCQSSPTRCVFRIGTGNRVVQCGTCRLQFAEQYPAYQDADADIYSHDYFAPAIRETRRRERIFSELLSELESMLGRKGRLLDVGAGEGTLVKTAVDRGWQAEGTEISTAMIRHMRENLGLVAHQGVLEDIALETGSFDAIILNHVLEHVKDPGRTLSRVGDLLTADGVTRIEVPNLASLSSRLKNTQSRMRLKRNPWKHYSSDHHFWFFTPTTLQRTIERIECLSLVELSAPARQWGETRWLDRAMNSLYKRTLWGGHIVAYAGCHRPVASQPATTGG